MEPMRIGDDAAAYAGWTAAPDLPGLVGNLLAAVRPLLGAVACSVALVEADGQLRFVAAAGAGAVDIVGQTMPTDRGVAGWAVATGQAISIGDVESDARFHRDLAESTGYVPNHITAIPLQTDRATVGVLEVLDGDHAVLTSAAGTTALNGLASTVTGLTSSLGGMTSTSAERAAADALAQLDDNDPELAEHVMAIVRALSGGGRGGFRR
jgi:GAF domain-containing protein